MNDELVLGHAILKYKGRLTVELLNAPLIVNSSSQSSMVHRSQSKSKHEIHNLGQSPAGHLCDKVDVRSSVALSNATHQNRTFGIHILSFHECGEQDVVLEERIETLAQQRSWL